MNLFKKQDNVLAKILLFGIAGAVTLSSCLDDDNAFSTKNNTLKLSVSTQPVQTKGIIETSTLPSSSKLSVTVSGSTGSVSAYDGNSYSNILFTASGVGTSQSWSGASNIMLSSTEGTLYAFFPGDKSTTESITQKKVETASQTDYMYANPVSNLCDATAECSVNLKHALSDIRMKIVKGTYTGAGVVTGVYVKGGGYSTEASLNCITGVLSGFTGYGVKIYSPLSITLTTSSQNADIIVIPIGLATGFTIGITIDGKEYTTQTDPVILKQGNKHEYTVTVNDKALSLSDVSVGDWGYDNAGNTTIDVGKKVTFSGDTKNIAFENKVENGVLTIKATGTTLSKCPRPVTCTGSADMEQKTEGDGRTRTITLSNVSSDCTITFSGVSSLDYIPYGNATAGYYIYSDETAALGYDEADGKKMVGYCIGKFGGWTLKTGSTSSVVKVTGEYTKNLIISTSDMDSSGKEWDTNSDNISVQPDFSRYWDHITNTSKFSNKPSYNAWRYVKSLSQLNGNWYIPSISQLYIIWAMLPILPQQCSMKSYNYWSCSEYSNCSYAMSIDFSNGLTNYNWKVTSYYIRPVRDLD